jgi:hypothetical protein
VPNHAVQKRDFLARLLKWGRAALSAKEWGMNSRRFAHSFRRTVELKPEETCSLKHHYRGAMREVVGLLDMWASNDPERFVYAGVDAIVKHCKRYQQPKNKYGARWVKYVLAALRARNIISERVLRVRKGEKIEGFIVALHEHLVLPISESRCRLVGMAAPFNCWKQAIGPDNLPYGPVWWVALASGNAPHSAPNSAPHSAPNNALQHSPHVPDEESTSVVNLEPNRGNRVNHSAFLSVKTITTPAETGDQLEVEEKSNTNPKSVDVGKAQDKGVNDKTIGQHFAVAAHPGFQTITAGLLNTKTEAWGRFEGADDLLLICWDVLNDFSEQPYLGHETNAWVMSLAMQRFNAAHGDVPPSWLKVLNDLKRAS